VESHTRDHSIIDATLEDRNEGGNEQASRFIDQIAFRRLLNDYEQSENEECGIFRLESMQCSIGFLGFDLFDQSRLILRVTILYGLSTQRR
jgi:hypothetical protein